jgi:hypothetical protein
MRDRIDAIRRMQVLDLSGERSDDFEKERLGRSLNEAKANPEISDMFLKQANQLERQILSSQAMEEESRIDLTSRTAAANKEKAIDKQLAQSVVTLNQDGDIALSEWFKRLVPKESHQAIIDLIILMTETVYHAIIAEHGSFQENIVNYLGKSFNNTVEKYGKNEVSARLMLSASQFLMESYQAQQLRLAQEEIVKDPKIPSLDETNSGKMMNFVFSMINNVNAAFLPAYVRHRFSQVVENALGDGNCAFNAFILGFSQRDVLNRIESQLRKDGISPPDAKFKSFITKAAVALKTEATWDAVKRKIFDLRIEDKKQLQEKLAPVMRELAIEQSKNDAKNVNEHDEPLKSAFQEYVLEERRKALPDKTKDMDDDLRKAIEESKKTFEAEQRNRKLLKDDIYDKHEFIKEEFKKIAGSDLAKLTEKDIDAKQKTLLEWWHKKDGGYQQFLTSMQEPGKWAGDLELAQLANYFGVNLDAQLPGFTHHVHFDHGVLPVSIPQKDELIARGVLEHPLPSDKEMRILVSPREAQQRLDKVPDFDDVVVYIEEHSENLGTRPIFDTSKFSPECVAELQKRDVISFDSGVYRFAIANADKAYTLIDEIENKEDIITALDKKNKNLPTITLLHEGGNHWNNRKSEFSVMEARKQVEARMEEWNNEPKNVKWEELIKTINAAQEKEKAEALAKAKGTTTEEQLVEYLISPKTPTSLAQTVLVTKEKQIELDEALARKIQREDLGRGKGPSRRGG